MRLAWPATASSMALSSTSATRWCSARSSVPPMYMPGRLRTGSSPSSTSIELRVVGAGGGVVAEEIGGVDHAGPLFFVVAASPRTSRRTARPLSISCPAPAAKRLAHGRDPAEPAARRPLDGRAHAAAARHGPDRPGRLAAARRGLRAPDGRARPPDRRAPGRVHAMPDAARPAAEELLALVLAHLDGVPGYVREDGAMRRPDGGLVPLDGPPLARRRAAGAGGSRSSSRRPEGDGRARADRRDPLLPVELDACPRSSAMPLVRIHLPVELYDETVARRVQRLFDAVRPEAPLMRANLIPYADATLLQPAPRVRPPRPGPGAVRFVRVERQTLLRLPVDPRGGLLDPCLPWCRPPRSTAEQRARLEAVRPGGFAAGAGVRVFVLTGAGVSAESGLGTFRDEGGHLGAVRPDEARDARRPSPRDPERVHAFYNMRRRNLLAARPNAAHRRARPGRGRARGARRRRCSSAPRTSTTCTSRPAAARSTTCMASS